MSKINNISPEKYVPVRKQRNKNYNAKTGQLICSTLCETSNGTKPSRKAA